MNLFHKQKEEILRQLEEMQRQSQPKQTGELSKHDDYIKAVKNYKKNMNKVRYMENMEKSSYITFSKVLEMMKKYRQHNLRFRRTGWNGKDMYITLQCPDENSKMTQPYIYMKTADDNLVPWVASQTDLLAEDWEQLPENYDEIKADE
jgi:hypothetical protein